MAAREPFNDEQMEQYREALKDVHKMRKEVDRAERVGLNVERFRADADRMEKQLAAVIHEYGDDQRP